MKAKKQTFLSVDNLVGLVLALLIVFEYKFENDIRLLLNSPAGIAISLVLLFVMFIFLNPIVGLLFLIYLYENVKMDFVFNSSISQENTKSSIMNRLNILGGEEDVNSVEKEVISKMAPIIKKRENPNVNFVPHVEEKASYSSI